jgi:hypothetical protein
MKRPAGIRRRIGLVVSAFTVSLASAYATQRLPDAAPQSPQNQSPVTPPATEPKEGTRSLPATPADGASRERRDAAQRRSPDSTIPEQPAAKPGQIQETTPPTSGEHPRQRQDEEQPSSSLPRDARERSSVPGQDSR